MLPRLKISKDYEGLWRVHMLVWCERGAPLHFTLARFLECDEARVFVIYLLHGTRRASFFRSIFHIPTIIEQHEAAGRARGDVTCQV